MYPRHVVSPCIAAILILVTACALSAQTGSTISPAAAADPGLRGGPAGAGDPLPGLTPVELAAFNRFKIVFNEAETPEEGLGPLFNLDSCGGCHAQPAIGGTSPKVNPQIALATHMGANNRIPAFLRQDGPIREARRVAGGPDIGGVVNLFSIRGRSDARGCTENQPDFSNPGNFRFRIPTPTFGLGLIEAITDDTLRDNLASNQFQKRALGISGRLNINGNDGTVMRFGWKSQNKSLVIFSGEAYNVEAGITNELFPQERAENRSCISTTSPEDSTDLVASTPSDVVQFAVFMKFLNQPAQAQPADGSERAAVASGRNAFERFACHLCHTPALPTGRASSAAVSQKTANLFSDLALHNMGAGLADGISQGVANGNEFRTAPLWGLGQRIFFLHDGRTSNLVQAILEHSSPGSEANASVAAFRNASPAEQTQLLKFLRSL